MRDQADFVLTEPTFNRAREGPALLQLLPQQRLWETQKWLLVLGTFT